MPIVEKKTYKKKLIKLEKIRRQLENFNSRKIHRHTVLIFRDQIVPKLSTREFEK